MVVSVKKILKYFCFIMIGLSLGYFIFNNKSENKLEEVNEPKIKKNINTLSMMLETGAGSGNYEMTTRSEWPTKGYKFNADLSVCEHGSELSWDDTNKTVLMIGNTSDKCYIYFDKSTMSDTCNLGQKLSECVISMSDVDDNIYHHDNSLTNGAGDNSYRYAGGDPNNYVCFGSTANPCPTDNLYRIIGVFGDQVKLIKYDYATSALLGTDGDYSTNTYAKSSYSTYKGELTTINIYYWNKSTQKNTWSESNLNKVNLNTNFINNIGTEWAEKIAKTTWKVGGNTYANIVTSPMYTAYQNEITNAVTTNTTDGKTEYSAKIGLMYVSDYGYAASPTYWTYPGYSSSGASPDYRAATTSNWMYMGLAEWTISRRADGSDFAFHVNNGGFVGDNFVDDTYGVRPSFNLITPTTYYGGTGSMSDPIKLREIGKFTIDDTVLQIGYPNVTCDFEVGMTWREFINSEYNTVGLKSNGSEAYFPTDYKPGDEDWFVIPGSLDDLIENNTTYEPAV